MAEVKFRGLGYELPFDLTNREMMDVERISGSSALEVHRALKRKTLSWGMVVALMHIAMRRAGATIALDELLDAPMEDFDFEDDGDEAEADAEEPQPVSPLPDAAADTTTAATPETPASAGAQS